MFCAALVANAEKLAIESGGSIPARIEKGANNALIARWVGSVQLSAECPRSL